MTEKGDFNVFDVKVFYPIIFSIIFVFSIFTIQDPYILYSILS